MTPLNKQIIALRKQGLSYSQIAKKLNCSKSTVSYALTAKTRKLAKEKHDRMPRHEKLIYKKISTFKSSVPKKIETKQKNTNKTPRQISKAISNKAHTFQKTMTFNYEDVYAKYGDHFPCALTGRPLDFKKPHTYEYDHIIPTSRGGDNSLSNMQIVCPEVNRAKQNLTDDEFLDLCKEVVIHHGHKIYKPVDL